MAEPHPNVLAARARNARSARLLAAWYGYPAGDKEAARRAEREPVRRRRYTGGFVWHCVPGAAPLPVPPRHDVGQDRLREILRAWRTPEWADASGWDDAHGGGVRRLLKAAGLALQDPDDDGVERADALVQMAAMSIRLRLLSEKSDMVARRIAALPKGVWRIDLAGRVGLKEDPPVREI